MILCKEAAEACINSLNDMLSDFEGSPYEHTYLYYMKSMLDNRYAELIAEEEREEEGESDAAMRIRCHEAETKQFVNPQQMSFKVTLRLEPCQEDA